ncbi:MAG: diaminobutyrate--2-oxoglutarate transaminase [Mesorhizobium sp.]|uniref:diaminobutyrate--2-oxoglutarate transaminase n=1 Tax=unclassified Mesorhizobium TaxID=325217 RepID=UPI000F75DB0E|nr:MULTISPECIES: diaminobutyrate--2-oxoglutarate transaminase [unclassified Mesorhizobium]RWB65262.1 MAG: diaminobutyrate--2-oxoglutarate transaminase [Mesorhizobium sp.]AZN98087.1 diaminobutyrate--2-oxoglutarate transaminase [Mesorhizobium sp. M9A.F.Ca.ET.002.03.1.2]AZO19492.1 diaminobutyrate--2-oxoglutarate transaminase [Mesorhizobium sp. M1E.F.Ca.ET.045.02.1.1]TGQ36884.1 diaminobutyrate--2-oxoglutarate transaminase [Mesorhizobium sp. M00.F.Ca.ET.216.01.1.1]TIT15135.1 MAG: diaminobutyrate--2
MKEDIESEARSYCRFYPAIFVGAKGSYLIAETGDKYLDFLAGCGSLNYGHNDQVMQSALQDYISNDGIALGLDLRTRAKQEFIDTFEQLILRPRSLEYRIQFTGPTGANAVEAAIKLARKVTGRSNIIAFTNAFHGCSLGALALTANSYHRGASASMLHGVHRAMYDGYLGLNCDTAELLRKQLSDPSGGIDRPAAVILEIVQAEGGINVPTLHWVKEIEQIARRHGALLIVDEIQTGCGRTGPFFAFEVFDIRPDIVLMAKSISGFGLPMSLVLIAPNIDIWGPGEHNGTFRGNNHAFVTATAALQKYWSDKRFESEIRRKGRIARAMLSEFGAPLGYLVKGCGLMLGLDIVDKKLAAQVKAEAYKRKLIVELCGPSDEIIKLMPPLTILDEELVSGINVLLSTISTTFCPERANRAVGRSGSGDCQFPIGGYRPVPRQSGNVYPSRSIKPDLY